MINMSLKHAQKCELSVKNYIFVTSCVENIKSLLYNQKMGSDILCRILIKIQTVVCKRFDSVSKAF